MSETRARPLKWLVTGMLGTLVLMVALLVFLILRFSPLVVVDQSEGKVKLLGGLIEIDQGTGSIRVDGRSLKDSEAEYRRFHGRRLLDPAQVKQVRIPFLNAKMDLSVAEGTELRWTCNLNQKDKGTTSAAGDTFNIDLSRAQGAQCGFFVPPGLKVTLTGMNGEITVHKPAYEIDARLANGEVDIIPDPNRHYRYDLSVTNGSVDAFDSSTAPDALRIAVHIDNGKIHKD